MGARGRIVDSVNGARTLGNNVKNAEKANKETTCRIVG
jgi:hypothetical protein